MFRLRVALLTALVAVTACSDPTTAPLSPADEGPTPLREVKIDLAARNTRGHPKATLTLSDDRSLSIAIGGHTLVIKNGRGVVDGRVQVRFDKASADFVDLAMRDMEAARTPEARRLLDVAQRYADTRRQAAFVDTASNGASALRADPCIEMGLAFYEVNTAVNRFWENYLGDLAFDIFKDVVVTAAQGSAGVTTIAIVIDLGAAYVEYEYLKLQRDIVGGWMRAQGCV